MYLFFAFFAIIGKEGHICPKSEAIVLNLQVKYFNKKVKLGLGVTVIASIFIITYFSWSFLINKNLPTVNVVPVEKQEFTAEINTSGILQCIKQQDFYAGTNSIVKEIRKNEGSRVTIGEAILLLDNSIALRELGKAENTLALLENEYLQAVSNKVYLMNKRDEAREKLELLEQQYAKELVTFNDVEAARTVVVDLENQIKAINLNTLESEVNKGRLTVQEARENLANTVITSPFEGTVLRMAVNRGEPVNKDKFLFSIGKTDNLEVIAFVNEYDAIKVQEEQPVEIYSEALKGKTYWGHVAQIAPLAEVEQTSAGPESKVKLKIALEEMTEELKPGYTVNVNILLDKKSDALVVPKEAIVQQDGENYVFVYEDGIAKRRVVEIGLSSESLQEITSGLQEGQMVIINPQEGIYDNMKIKAHSDT